MIADGLHISSERALDLFYQSSVYEMLVDPRYGLQTMSDTYIYDEFMMELHGGAEGGTTANEPISAKAAHCQLSSCH